MIAPNLNDRLREAFAGTYSDTLEAYVQTLETDLSSSYRTTTEWPVALAEQTKRHFERVHRLHGI